MRRARLFLTALGMLACSRHAEPPRATTIASAPPTTTSAPPQPPPAVRIDDLDVRAQVFGTSITHMERVIGSVRANGAWWAVIQREDRALHGSPLADGLTHELFAQRTETFAMAAIGSLSTPLAPWTIVSPPEGHQRLVQLDARRPPLEIAGATPENWLRADVAWAARAGDPPSGVIVLHERLHDRTETSVVGRVGSIVERRARLSQSQMRVVAFGASGPTAIVVPEHDQDAPGGGTVFESESAAVSAQTSAIVLVGHDALPERDAIVALSFDASGRLRYQSQQRPPRESIAEARAGATDDGAVWIAAPTFTHDVLVLGFDARGVAVPARHASLPADLEVRGGSALVLACGAHTWLVMLASGPAREELRVIRLQEGPIGAGSIVWSHETASRTHRDGWQLPQGLCVDDTPSVVFGVDREDHTWDLALVSWSEAH